MSVALWKEIQAFVGVKADGIPGDVTAAAVAAKLGIEKATPVPASSDIVPDSRSAANIATLQPRAQAKAREWLAKCLAEGINVKIICGTRTFAEQNELYAHGRGKPGPKVTNAPAGYSWHNFGVGWDFVVFDSKGQPLWESPENHRCGEIAESLGLEWGGHWKGFPDEPHIQLPGLPTLAEARQLAAAGKWKVA